MNHENINRETVINDMESLLDPEIDILIFKIDIKSYLINSTKPKWIQILEYCENPNRFKQMMILINELSKILNTEKEKYIKTNKKSLNEIIKECEILNQNLKFKASFQKIEKYLININTLENNQAEKIYNIVIKYYSFQNNKEECLLYYKKLQKISSEKYYQFEELLLTGKNLELFNTIRIKIQNKSNLILDDYYYFIKSMPLLENLENVKQQIPLIYINHHKIQFEIIKFEMKRKNFEYALNLCEKYLQNEELNEEVETLFNLQKIEICFNIEFNNYQKNIKSDKNINKLIELSIHYAENIFDVEYIKGYLWYFSAFFEFILNNFKNSKKYCEKSIYLNKNEENIILFSSILEKLNQKEEAILFLTDYAKENIFISLQLSILYIDKISDDSKFKEIYSILIKKIQDFNLLDLEQKLIFIHLLIQTIVITDQSFEDIKNILNQLPEFEKNEIELIISCLASNIELHKIEKFLSDVKKIEPKLILFNFFNFQKNKQISFLIFYDIIKNYNINNIKSSINFLYQGIRYIDPISEQLVQTYNLLKEKNISFSPIDTIYYQFLLTELPLSFIQNFNYSQLENINLQFYKNFIQLVLEEPIQNPNLVLSNLNQIINQTDVIKYLFFNKNFDKLIDYIYNLYYQNSESFDSYNNWVTFYTLCLEHNVDIDSLFKKHEISNEETVVFYIDILSKKENHISFTTNKSTNPFLFEKLIDDFTFKNFLNKKINDIIEIQSILITSKYKITNIKNKKLFCFEHCIHTIQDKFPSQSTIQHINILNDQNEIDINKIFEFFPKKIKSHQIDLDTQYKTSPIPIPFNFLDQFGYKSNNFINALNIINNLNLKKIKINLSDTSIITNNITLHSSSIITLIFLDFLIPNLIESIFNINKIQFKITETTYYLSRTYIRELKLKKLSSANLLNQNNILSNIIKYKEWNSQNIIQSYEKILKKCTIIPTNILQYSITHRSTKLQNNFFKEEINIISSIDKNDWICADDTSSAIFESENLKNLDLEILSNYLYQENLISFTTYKQIKIFLYNINYNYVEINSDWIKDIGIFSDWNSNIYPLKKFIEIINTSNQSTLIGYNMLFYLWKNSQDFQKNSILTYKILNIFYDKSKLQEITIINNELRKSQNYFYKNFEICFKNWFCFKKILIL